MKAVRKGVVSKRSTINSLKDKESKISYKWISISMFFCLSIPLVFLMCLYAISLISGRGVFDPILMNSKITLAFIISMLGIFCAYVCNRSVKILKEKNDSARVSGKYFWICSYSFCDNKDV